MKLTLVHISPRRAAKSRETDLLTSSYTTRANRYFPCTPQAFPAEAAFLLSLEAPIGRARPHLILLDSRGQQLSSEAFAGLLGRLRDAGTQHTLLAVGPADGWSPAARPLADTLLSLGPMTLPHELARVLLAEQVFRAGTILAGHPYHSGH